MHRLRLIAHNLVLTAALLAGTCCVARAQVLSIFNVDTSAFPDMQAEFVMLDAAGNPMRDFSAADFVLSEDAYTIGGNFTIDCPNSAEASPIHAVLVCDRSGSMVLPIPSGISRLDLLKRGAISFVNAVRFISPTSVAVTAFDDAPLLLSYFASTTPPLVGAINGIQLGGGTNYTPAFVDNFAGGIGLLEKVPPGVRRVLIFLTDGLPNNRPDMGQIIFRANNANVSIYSITLGMPMTELLRTLSDNTGGKTYGDVTDEDAMRAVYTAIALDAQGVSPCKVRWRSGPACGANSAARTFKMVWRPKVVTATAHYTAPARAVIDLAADPSDLWFGAIGPGDSALRPIVLTAHGGPMLITSASITAGSPFEVVDWGGVTIPFTLPENQSLPIKVRFKPVDSSVQTATLTFTNDQCPIQPITLSGGVARYRAISRLTLLSPVGGESFSGCDSIMIRWAGIAPTDPVSISYSANDGGTWHPVATGVRGLRYAWFPPAPGTRYRIRIQSATAGFVDSITTVAPSSGPVTVLASGDSLYYSGGSLQKLDLYSAQESALAPGVDARGLALAGQFLYIADYAGHRVRRLDLAANVVNTVAGTGTPGFSGDNGTGINAQLQFPNGLAVGRDALYISDNGNNRVRRIDFKTNVITTVAGGGFVPDGDGSLATSVTLNGPQGLAFVSDPRGVSDSLYIVERGANRLRVVDMRTGIISTVAGTGTAGFSGDGRMGFTAQLNAPSGVFINGDRIYISDTKNNRIRVVSRATGIIRTIAGVGTAGFSGDKGSALLAELNHPAGLGGDEATLYVADSVNDRLRAIRMGEVGNADSSAASFTVTVGQVAVSVPGKRVAFGTMSVGAARDTAIAALACNAGNIPMTIDSAAIVGADSSDFEIVSGLTAATLPPGSCIPIELRFHPSALGSRSASVIFYGRCSGTDTLRLSGTAVAPCGFTVRDRVDFGSIDVGSSKDSTATSLLCNTGSTTLSGRVAIVPADGMFSILSGGGSYSLAPGECLSITVRFHAAGKGDAAALLDYGIPSSCGPASTTLAGHGITQQALAAYNIRFADAACTSGARDTVLIISNMGDAPLLISGLQIANNNEGFSILSPIPSSTAPLRLPPDSLDSVAIRFNPAGIGPKSATLRITSNSSTSPDDILLTGRRDLRSLTISHAFLAFDGRLPSTDYPIDSLITIHNSGTLPITFSAANISGNDSAQFQIGPGQLPLTIQPGDSATFRVRVLAPMSGVAATALLELTLDDACDSNRRTVRLIESGSLPAILAATPVVRPIVCPDETQRDTVISVSNPGGAALVITAVTVHDLGTPAFTPVTALPITILPGASADLPIRFAASTPGTYTADIVLTSNAASGDSVVHLVATRELLAFSALPALLDFGLVPMNAVRQLPDSILNAGTVPADLAVTTASASVTGFSAGAATLRTLLPGETTPASVIFTATATGSFDDTLIITDKRCGTVRRVALHASVFEPIRTVVVLPVDSSARGVTVSLPIRLTIVNRDRFAQSGARAYRMKLGFSGAVLMPVEAIGAVITDTTYDDRTAHQTVTISGSFDIAGYAPGTGAGSGQVLAVLRCRVPASDSLITPLRFEEFVWDKPEVTADTVNGMFRTYGDCGVGVWTASQVHVTKLVPQPAGIGSMRVTAELELESEQQVHAMLVDAKGTRVRDLGQSGYRAGYQALELEVSGLASGLYWLVVESPFGEDSAPLIIAR